MKMPKLFLRLKRLDKIKNEVICSAAHVRQLQNKLRECRIKLFNHVQRMKEDYMRKTLQMNLLGKRVRC